MVKMKLLITTIGNKTMKLIRKNVMVWLLAKFFFTIKLTYNLKPVRLHIAIKLNAERRFSFNYLYGRYNNVYNSIKSNGIIGAITTSGKTTNKTVAKVRTSIWRK